MRINCQTIAGVVNWVFPVHMSNSRLQIAPWRPKNIHETWDRTYIRRNTLFLYFLEDMEVCWGMECSCEHFVTECHVEVFCHALRNVVHCTCISSRKYKQSVFLRMWVLSHVPWIFSGLWGAIWSLELDICTGNTQFTTLAIVWQSILMVRSLCIFFKTFTVSMW
jgi:hypothetical protein